MMTATNITVPLRELMGGVHVLGRSGPADPEIRGITCDSRLVRPGWVYVAVRGHQYDGAVFVEDAVRRGASAVVTESREGVHRNVSTIRVACVRTSLAMMSVNFFHDPSSAMQVLGVTGTNGKTTVAFMCRDILKTAGRVPGLIGTVRYEIGERCIPAGRTTPDAPEIQHLLSQMRKSGCKSVAMEVSSHALDQHRTDGIRFDAAVFTNLTQDHLDYHRTFENYYAAKKRLFEGLSASGKASVAVINMDSDWGEKLLSEDLGNVSRLRFGMRADADVCAEEIEVGGHGSTFRLCTPWGTEKIQTNLPGRFNVSNTLAAVAACGAVGVEFDVITQTLAGFEPVPGRLQDRSSNKDFKVFIDYAHTPDALQNVLIAIREIADQRIISVFGCGGDRDQAKRPQMGTVAAAFSDYSVITSDNSRTEDPEAIISQIATGFSDQAGYETITDRRAAIERAISMARTGDIVLIAGKGHETYQEFGHTMVPFDDCKVAAEFLGGEQI